MLNDPLALYQTIGHNLRLAPRILCAMYDQGWTGDAAEAQPAGVCCKAYQNFWLKGLYML